MTALVALLFTLFIFGLDNHHRREIMTLERKLEKYERMLLARAISEDNKNYRLG